MRRVLIAAAVLLTAAATQGADRRPCRGTGGCAAHQSEFAALTDLTEAEAIAPTVRMPGTRTVGVATPAQPVMRDGSPDRATLLMRGGRVERVPCG